MNLRFLRSEIICSFLLLLAVRGAAFGQQPPVDTDFVLIPVGGTREPINGALGSRWVIEQYERNIGPTAVTYDSANCAFPECTFDFPPGETQMTLGYPYSVYLLKNNADQMRYTIVVRDISRQNESWGAEIPAVRGRDLRSDGLELVHIPMDSAFRRNLRLYAVWRDGRGGIASLRVRAYDALADLKAQSVLVGEREVTLDASVGSEPGYIGYMSLNMDDLLTSANAEAVRLVIDRLAGTAEMWAFVTLTNNVTQHVTVITP